MAARPLTAIQVAWSRALVDRLVNRTTMSHRNFISSTVSQSPPSNNNNTTNNSTRRGLGGNESTREKQEAAKKESERARSMWEKRLVFLSGGNEGDLAALFQASDVVLDAFPASGYVTSLQVLDNLTRYNTNSSRYLTIVRFRLLVLHPTISHALTAGVGSGGAGSHVTRLASRRSFNASVIPKPRPASQHYCPKARFTGI